MPAVATNRITRLQRAALILVALLLPALFALYLALTTSPLSVRDYWAMMSSIYSTEGFSTNLADWFVSQNGHIVFIPRLIYVLNMFVTSGSNVGLALTAWGFTLVQAVMLIWLIPADIRDFRVKLLVIMAISGFSFIPTATNNSMYGFSGVHWMLANVFSLGAIIGITRYFQGKGYSWIIISFILAGLALITYGTALGVWLALVAAFVFVRSKWPAGLVVIGLTVVAFAISLATRPSLSPSSVTWLDRVIVFGPYLAIFIGGVFTTNIPLAFVIGSVGLIAGSWVLIKLGFLANFPTRLIALPWLLVLVYCLVNIALIAVARLEFGLGYATTLRYATLSGPVWIVILVMWAYRRYSVQERYTWLALTPYLVTILLLLVAMLPLGLDRVQYLSQRASVQPLVMLSIDLDIPDKPLIDEFIIHREQLFLDQIPALKADRLVPFNKPPRNQCGQPGQQVPLSLVSDTASISGDFEFIDPISPDGVRVRTVGWLEAPPDPASIECIILADQTGTIKGRALPGFIRPDLQNSARTGWVGYAHLSHPDDQLTVYLKPANTPNWMSLPQTRSRSNPGQIRLEVYTAMAGSFQEERPGLESFNRFLGYFGYTPPKTDIQPEMNE